MNSIRFSGPLQLAQLTRKRELLLQLLYLEPLAANNKLLALLLHFLTGFALNNQSLQEEYCYNRYWNKSDYFKGYLSSSLRRNIYGIAALIQRLAVDRLQTQGKVHYRRLLRILHCFTSFDSFSAVLTNLRLINTTDAPVYRLKWVGVVILLQYAFLLIKKIRLFFSEQPKQAIAADNQTEPVQTNQLLGNCLICQDNIQRPAVGRCGHISCWECLTHYAFERGECPACRSQIQPNQVVFLRNI